MTAPLSLFQRCETCGRDEYAGAYCTFCRTGTYWLAEHPHGVGGKQGACSLGPFLDPLDQGPSHRRQFEHDRAAWAAIERPSPVVRRWLHVPRPSRNRLVPGEEPQTVASGATSVA